MCTPRDETALRGLGVQETLSKIIQDVLEAQQRRGCETAAHAFAHFHLRCCHKRLTRTRGPRDGAAATMSAAAGATLRVAAARVRSVHTPAEAGAGMRATYSSVCCAYVYMRASLSPLGARLSAISTQNVDIES